MKNRTKERLASGQVVVGVQLRMGNPAIAELFGNAGFDYVAFDTEHTPQTPIGIQHQIQALASTPATPIVRLAENDTAIMRTYLDMGVLGLIVPFVLTAADARIGASAMRYPPVGTRGYGPSRASQFGFDVDYFKTADQDMLYLALIEDELAVRNIDEILATEGVDAFFIGPADLSLSLGVPRQYDHPKFRAAMDSIIKAGQASKKPMGIGIHSMGADIYNPDIYQHLVDRGFRLLTAAGDEWVLQAGCRNLVECAAAARR